MAWSASTTTNGGWNTTSTPINLTGATINAQIIRRQILDLKDGRTGLEFKIVDYPLISLIENVTATNSADNTMVCDDTSMLFLDQPVRFTGNVFGGVAINTTYYIKAIITQNLFTISDTQGGTTKVLSSATGTMGINRVAPSPVTLPITNRNDANGTFTLTIDDDTWGIIAGDPELNIDANNPVCFTGRVKISFPPQGSQPAYDECIFLLFLVVSDGVVN